ncbi:hypothetical protein E2C01_044430 [Portunus trituberculatus]|uniref:Uncharacterized protein n=1 Tax=Portunus trituberculatus TaxID=210409 RepID=A0A5B7FT39_PORTR|nr:hypothetical protein [Portunus trituberculatus]
MRLNSRGWSEARKTGTVVLGKLSRDWCKKYEINLPQMTSTYGINTVQASDARNGSESKTKESKVRS